MKKIAIFIGSILLSIIIVGFLYDTSYNIIISNRVDYQKSSIGEMKKYKNLTKIANDTIETGKGINTEKIPDFVEYSITTTRENVIYSYTFKDTNDKVIITLSNNYEILNTEFNLAGVKEDKELEKEREFFSKLLAFLLILGIFILAFTIVISIQFIISKKKA